MPLARTSEEYGAAAVFSRGNAGALPRDERGTMMFDLSTQTRDAVDSPKILRIKTNRADVPAISCENADSDTGATMPGNSKGTGAGFNITTAV